MSRSSLGRDEDFRTLVEGYGGDVWIEDAEPAGTEVNVRLPRAE